MPTFCPPSYASTILSEAVPKSHFKINVACPHLSGTIFHSSLYLGDIASPTLIKKNEKNNTKKHTRSFYVILIRHFFSTQSEAVRPAL